MECPHRSPSVWSWSGGIRYYSDSRRQPGVRAEDRRVIVYSMDPQIKQNVHFRAFACLDQFMGFSNWKKEKARILFTGIIVFQGSIIILPVSDPEFDQAVFLQQGNR